MLKIAICDDSRTDIEMLECAFDKLRHYPIEYDVYFSGEELLKYYTLHEEVYHLYIFDIEMPELNGLGLAKKIREKDARALFVFLTSYTKYVMDVFDVITFDYISKPITAEKLESVLLKVVRYLNLIKQDFVFQFRKNQFRISCDDILYFEKKGRQAVIHTNSEIYKTNMTTEELWKQLDNKVFSHIHVSYTINIAHIKAIDGDEVVLDNEERFLIARSHKQSLKEKHMEFMRRTVQCMEYIIRFSVNLFDLAMFWYYLNSFKKMKSTPKILFVMYIMAMAAIWSGINALNYPFLNLLTLVSVLLITSLFFESAMWSRLVNIVVFVGVGMIIEPIGLILLHAMNYVTEADGVHKYYFVVVLCAFTRGNVLYLLSKVLSKKNVRLSKVPKEIVNVLAMILGFSILNCCFVIILSMKSGSSKSLIMCISIIISIVLSYYFMLQMMERFNYLARKRHEDEMYRKEMYYKEQYYSEVERRNEYVHNLKHDMKNKLIELHYLLEKGDIQGVAGQLSIYCDELEKIDENNYCNNPIVDSVLRIKFGVAKSDKIKINTTIRIPKQMQLEHGDIGVLYGNLLDNAIEACRKVEDYRRFIRIENKFTEGKLLLIVENSKTEERNESLKTTKKDNYSHGRGIHSVRKVVEKYNGRE